MTSETRLSRVEQDIGDLKESLSAFMLESTKIQTRLTVIVEHQDKAVSVIGETLKDLGVVIDKRIERIRDDTEKHFDAQLKVCAAEHLRVINRTSRRPLTKAQIVAWGTLLTTVMGGLGYIVRVIFK